MLLCRNEIKIRALAFTQEWKDEVSDDAEAKTFWNDLFNVFGISRRRVVTFDGGGDSGCALEGET